MHDEELGTCGVRTHGACHGDHSAGVLQIIGEPISGEFALDGVAGTAGPASVRVASLDHEAADHPMEDQPVIVSFLCQRDEIVDCVGSNLRI